MLGREWILAHIPHQAGMCLIDQVLEWDASRLCCTSASHLSANNPLRRDGRLGAACAIEYAAQARASHGALAGIEQQGGRPGFLVSARAVETEVLRLDDLGADLEIEVTRSAAQSEQVLYEFRLTCAARPICRGRATVVLTGIAA